MTELLCNPELQNMLAPDVDVDQDSELLSVGFRIGSAVPVVE